MSCDTDVCIIQRWNDSIEQPFTHLVIFEEWVEAMRGKRKIAWPRQALIAYIEGDEQAINRWYFAHPKDRAICLQRTGVYDA